MTASQLARASARKRFRSTSCTSAYWAWRAKGRLSGSLSTASIRFCLLTRRMYARKRYPRMSVTSRLPLAAFSRRVWETVAAVSSNRLIAKAGSPSVFSAYRTAPGPISWAIDNTEGSIGLPRWSTEFSKNGRTGFRLGAWVPHCYPSPTSFMSECGVW